MLDLGPFGGIFPPMNRLSAADRAQILQLLCKGSSVPAVANHTGTSKNTVTKLLFDAGKACAAYHSAHMRNVKAKRVQIDQIYSFAAKQESGATASRADLEGGEAWTWTAVEIETKLILSALVGERDIRHATFFIDNVQSRITSPVKLILDGGRVYLEAGGAATGRGGYYAQLAELYRVGNESTERRNSSAGSTDITDNKIGEARDLHQVSSSYLEQHFTTQIDNRDLARTRNMFMKRVESHARAVALHVMYYNFVRIHPELRTTPAMAAGISDRIWEIADIVTLMESTEHGRTSRVGG